MGLRAGTPMRNAFPQVRIRFTVLNNTSAIEEVRSALSRYDLELGEVDGRIVGSALREAGRLQLHDVLLDLHERGVIDTAL